MPARSDTSIRSIHSRHAGRVTLALASLALILGATRAEAGRIAGTAGLDRFESSNGQWTRAVIGVAVLTLGRGDVLAGASGFDSPSGSGGAWIVGGGVPIASVIQLRGTATLVTGPDERRARRFQIGPRFLAANGSSLALSYTRDAEEGVAAIDGALAEASIPMVSTLAARGALGYAVTQTGERGARAGVGLGWSPLRHFELIADLGLAHQAIASTGQPLPATTRGVTDRWLPLPDPGDRDGSSEMHGDLTFTSLLGVRFPFP